MSKDVKKGLITDEIVEPEFVGEVWLSTDGKNTVRYESSTKEGRTAGGLWAKSVFDGIKKTYGTKQAQAVKEYAQNGVKTEMCDIHQVPMKERQGKNGRFYSHAKKVDNDWIYCNGKGWSK